MSYKSGEILVAAQVALVTGFTTSGQVGRGTKWIYLNSGKSDHYAILHKGQHTQEFFTGRETANNYRTIITVLQQAKDDLTDRYDDLLTYSDAIVTRLNQYRHLADTAGTIRDANITGGDEVKELWINGGTALAWIYADVYLDWTEDTSVTFAE